MSIKVFVSYANEDLAHRNRFMAEVGASRFAPLIDWLTDDRLVGGDRIDSVQRWIKEADVWLLLIGPWFAQSSYCIDKELEWVLGRERARRKGRICPVLLDRYDDCEQLDNLSTGSDAMKVVAFDWPLLERSEEVDGRFRRAAGEFVKMLEPIALEQRLIRRRRLDQFGREIERGWLTPFLGPSCTDTREHYEPALPHLRSQLSQLLSVLEGHGDQKAWQYATSIAKSRKVVLTGVEVVVAEERQRSEILTMQAAIARLGAACCELFGDALGRASQGLTDARTYGIVLGEAPPHLVRNVAEAMLKAATAAGNVDDDSTPHKWHYDGLSAIGIRLKLVTLASVLFDVGERELVTEASDADRWLDAFRTHLDSGESLGTKTRMALSHLEWVGDLLWHTLRYSAPLFPSPDDFAFQLAMWPGSPHSVARLPLALAATVGGEDSPVNTIVTHFDDLVSGAGTLDRRLSLSGGLSLLLQQPFAMRPTEDERPQRESVGVRNAAHKHQAIENDGPQVMLLSSNMDRNVERWLERDDVSFFTLYPVYYSEPISTVAATPHGGTRTFRSRGSWQSAWLLAAIEPRGSKRRYFYVPPEARFEDVVAYVRKHVPWQSTNAPSQWLPGPLVVRLRGAPLEGLPKPDCGDFKEIEFAGVRNSLGHKLEFRHRILLSPMDYSRELSGLHSPPRCLRELMLQNRVLLFLGHALDEPDGLFGLQTDVWLRRESEMCQRDAVDHVAIREERVSVDGVSPNEVGAALLSNMGITALDHSLDDVAGALVGMLESRQ